MAILPAPFYLPWFKPLSSVVAPWLGFSGSVSWTAASVRQSSSIPLHRFPMTKYESMDLRRGIDGIE